MLKTKKWNVLDHLKTEEEIKSFIAYAADEARETDDPGFIAEALGIAARARGMLATAQNTGLNRAGLYRALSKTEIQDWIR